VFLGWIDRQRAGVCSVPGFSFRVATFLLFYFVRVYGAGSPVASSLCSSLASFLPTCRMEGGFGLDVAGVRLVPYQRDLG